MPRVGSSSSSTDGPVSRHFASATFCWLPPDSLSTSVALLGVLIRSCAIDRWIASCSARRRMNW